jgi:PAS domain S-box-containing protein
MEPEQSSRVSILEHVPEGIALLDDTSLRVLYINSYLRTLLSQSGQLVDLPGSTLEELLPFGLYQQIEPPLREAATSGETREFTDLPFEGFLETRGRTYWHMTIVPGSRETLDAGLFGHISDSSSLPERLVVVTIEDVTDKVRARMHINAIHYISSAIARGYPLPRVLDRILESVQELVGSTRCAILLLESSMTSEEDTARRPASSVPTSQQGGRQLGPLRVSIAVQKGLHLSSQGWNPLVGEHLLLGQVLQTRHSLVIPNTNLRPEIEIPLLDDNGTPRRPGSVLCVPIFEPGPEEGRVGMSRGDILGTIEVYHRRVRGLPAEEVELLEQFALQVGLAIQNARLFNRNALLAQEARREVHQRENIMQAIPDGVIIYDSRWRVAEVNSAIRRLMGWSQDVIGLPIHEALAHSSVRYLDRSPSIEDMVAELERYPLEHSVDEFKMIGADGQQYAIRRSKAPIRDEQGHIFAYVVVYHDVTEQVTARESIEAQVIARTAELAQRNKALEDAREALSLEHARLDLLLARMPSGVILVSASDRRILVSNRQATRLLQQIRARRSALQINEFDDLDIISEPIIGEDIEELLRDIEVYGPDAAVLPYEKQPLYLALHQGQASEAELHLTLSNGQPLYLLVNAAPLRSNDGSITDVALVLQDITRVKALERAREDFFTTMAHELKTPLANIRAHLSALQARDYTWSTEEQMEFLRTADEQVERLVGMINHFLDASRVEAGALRLDLEPILLPELFEEVQERLEALIATSNRRLEIRIEQDTPAVMADYEMIISVLVNLLSNAFRYAPEGDAVRLEADTLYDSPDEQPSGVELRVVDRGSGITPEQQAALFTRFSTFAAARRPDVERPGQPTTQASGGGRWSQATGLGLYISRGIIEAHGSTLKLRSSPGEGTTFSFVLGVASLVRHEM